MPTSAGSWVMFARKPNRSTTGAELEFDAPVADEAQPAAKRLTAATPAVSSTRLIRFHLSRSIYYPDQLNREYRKAQLDSPRFPGHKLVTGQKVPAASSARSLPGLHLSGRGTDLRCLDLVPAEQDRRHLGQRVRARVVAAVTVEAVH